MHGRTVRTLIGVSLGIKALILGVYLYDPVRRHDQILVKHERYRVSDMHILRLDTLYIYERAGMICRFHAS